MTTQTADPAAEWSPAPQADIRVAVLDDHVVVRYGIELLLEHTHGYAFTGAASNSAELLRLLAHKPCHVLVLDYQLSSDQLDGWSLVRHLRLRYPHVRILVYTAYASLAVARVVRRAGAHGFLGKDAGLAALIDAIRSIAAGQKMFPAEAQELADCVNLEGGEVTLSPRENEVLRCCVLGMSVTDIAQKFRRSVKTISAQKLAAYRKLGVRNDHEFWLLYADTRPEVGWSRQ